MKVASRPLRAIAVAPAALGLTALVALASCRAPAPGAAAQAGAAPGAAAPKANNARAPWPTRSWTPSAPEAQGLDPSLLREAADPARAADLGLHSLLVVRNGFLASESYFQGRGRDDLAEQYSVTKSVVSTLVGVAIDRGELGGIETPLSALLDLGSIANPDPRKGSIAVQDLLEMRSGLAWTEGDAGYRAFLSSEDPTAYALGLPLASDPGAVFAYDSAAVHILSAALRRATGADPADYARRRLFGPLGIRRYEWERDRKGLSIGGWGLKLIPRDMAKLGYLALRGGEWEGKRVVSREWLRAATAPRSLDTGSSAGLGYGYLWWTFPVTAESGAVGGRGPPSELTEASMYAALGLGGQMILVAPRLDLVVVVTASTPDRGHGRIFDLVERFVLPAAAPSSGV